MRVSRKPIVTPVQAISQQRPPASLEEFIDLWKTLGYEVRPHGSKPTLVLFGETHNQGDYENDHTQRQAEFISFAKPPFVLHEFVKGLIYEPTGDPIKQPGREFGSPLDEEIEISHCNFSLPKVLKALSTELDFRIIGCDLTLWELEKLKKKLGKVLNKRLDLYSDEVQPPREAQMVKTTREYLPFSSPTKPIVCIIGSSHANTIEQSGVLEGFSYLYVNQSASREVLTA